MKLSNAAVKLDMTIDRVHLFQAVSDTPGRNWRCPSRSSGRLGHGRGVKVAEPSDPLHDTDFIQALMHTYDVSVTTDWLTDTEADDPSAAAQPRGKS